MTKQGTAFTTIAKALAVTAQMVEGVEWDSEASPMCGGEHVFVVWLAEADTTETLLPVYVTAENLLDARRFGLLVTRYTGRLFMFSGQWEYHLGIALDAGASVEPFSSAAVLAARLDAIDDAIRTVERSRRGLGVDSEAEELDGDLYFALAALRRLRSLVERRAAE